MIVETIEKKKRIRKIFQIFFKSILPMFDQCELNFFTVPKFNNRIINVTKIT